MDTPEDARYTLLETHIAEMKKTLDALFEAVVGDLNGKPGIVRTLDAVKSAIGFNAERTIHERVKALEIQMSILRWFVALVGASAIIQAIGFLADALGWLAKVK